MEASFWHNKWEIGQIGFHQNEVTPLFVKHFDKLQLAKESRIFLPLCGKTLDISYLLTQDYKVVGVELSEIAIIELFQELDLTPDISVIASLKRYQAHNIDIYVGDFFDLNADIVGEIDAIYDRASLIALPLEARQRYTKHLVKISKSAPQLIICLEYDQTIMDGPPFSIVPAEMMQHYADVYLLDCVESLSLADGLKGKYPAKDSAWILRVKEDTTY